jgi:hypothetical protein
MGCEYLAAPTDVTHLADPEIWATIQLWLMRQTITRLAVSCTEGVLKSVSPTMAKMASVGVLSLASSWKIRICSGRPGERI